MSSVSYSFHVVGTELALSERHNDGIETTNRQIARIPHSDWAALSVQGEAAAAEATANFRAMQERNRTDLTRKRENLEREIAAIDESLAKLPASVSGQA